MKKIATFLMCLSLTTLTVGCEKPGGTNGTATTTTTGSAAATTAGTTPPKPVTPPADTTKPEKPAKTTN